VSAERSLQGVALHDDANPDNTLGVNASGQAAIQNPPNLDAAISTLATESKLEAVRVLLASLDGKDYATQTTLATLATETKLEAVRVLLASIDGKDFATQTTLAAALAVLTDGTQRAKVTDGTNNASLIQDGSDYRLQVEAMLTSGNPVSEVNDFLKNGGSNDLKVDGTTPVDFEFPAHATDTYVLNHVRFVMSADAIDLDGASFGKGSALTNGILFDAVVNGGTALTLATVKVNVEFAQLFGFDLWQGGLDDLLIATFQFGGRTILSPGTGDKVRVRIQESTKVLNASTSRTVWST
jgi:hypothetical protein